MGSMKISSCHTATDFFCPIMGALESNYVRTCAMKEVLGRKVLTELVDSRDLVLLGAIQQKLQENGKKVAELEQKEADLRAHTSVESSSDHVTQLNTIGSERWFAQLEVFSLRNSKSLLLNRIKEKCGGAWLPCGDVKDEANVEPEDELPSTKVNNGECKSVLPAPSAAEGISTVDYRHSPEECQETPSTATKSVADEKHAVHLPVKDRVSETNSTVSYLKGRVTVLSKTLDTVASMKKKKEVELKKSKKQLAVYKSIINRENRKNLAGKKNSTPSNTTTPVLVEKRAQDTNAVEEMKFLRKSMAILGSSNKKYAREAKKSRRLLAVYKAAVRKEDRKALMSGKHSDSTFPNSQQPQEFQPGFGQSECTRLVLYPQGCQPPLTAPGNLLTESPLIAEIPHGPHPVLNGTPPLPSNCPPFPPPCPPLQPLCPPLPPHCAPLPPHYPPLPPRCPPFLTHCPPPPMGPPLPPFGAPLPPMDALGPEIPPLPLMVPPPGVPFLPPAMPQPLPVHLLLPPSFPRPSIDARNKCNEPREPVQLKCETEEVVPLPDSSAQLSEEQQTCDNHQETTDESTSSETSTPTGQGELSVIEQLAHRSSKGSVSNTGTYERRSKSRRKRRRVRNRQSHLA